MNTDPAHLPELVYVDGFNLVNFHVIGFFVALRSMILFLLCIRIHFLSQLTQHINVQ